LEGCRCVGETKWNHEKFEVAMRAERRLVDVIRVHAHQVVAAMKFNFGEELHPLQFIK